MAQDDQIPLDILKGMPPEQVNILLVQGFNTLVRGMDGLQKHVSAYGELLEKKIGRDEFGKFEHEIRGKFDGHEKRINGLEGTHQDNDVRKKFAFNLGKYFWIVILAIMNLLQFFYMLGDSNP